MLKKATTLFVAVFLLISICGCVAILAGAAGGAGTSVWLSGKLSREVNATFDKSIKATKSALHSLKLQITKETRNKDIAQVMGKYSDGRTIWIDIRPITQESSKIDIRVGAVNSDKEAADTILKRILRYL